MAKPDCDDGWYKKSIELEAALDFADFTKIARTILRYGFCQIFGQGRRPRYMVISCTEIAGRIRKNRQHVYRALDELIKSNVLVPIEGMRHTYKFVDEYEKWTQISRSNGTLASSSRPRLNPTEIHDCVVSPSYAHSFELEPLSYYDYLQSPEWKARRLREIARAGGRCELCNSQGPFHVHHRTYKRLGDEAPGDLVVLCPPCHQTFHEHRTLAGEGQ